MDKELRKMFGACKVVVTTNRYVTDQIRIYAPYLPTAFPGMGDYPVHFRVDARQGYGTEWCRQVLGVEPEIVEKG